MRREALAAALNNTYAHRAVTVLEHLGMRPAPLDQPVTLVTAIRTEEDYAAACRHRNRGGVGDILCLVSDNAEEGLLLSLSSRHEPGVAVELSRRVFSGEIRSRALIQTRSVLLGDVDRLPDETWIAKATPHLAVGVERVAASAGLYGSLMTAEMFDRFVCGGERLPALNALRG
jgi:hypothetical protein